MDFATLPRKADQLNSYEVVVILDPDTTLDQQKSIFQRSKSVIENYGGRVHSLDTWGRRQLANPIKKKSQGIYFHMLFQAKPASIAELERIMRISDQIMRFMHVKLDSRIPMEKHEERFKMALRETAEREKEREVKAQARRNTAASAEA